eukprot:COSAG01_NODE_12083_length_1803_cov_3.156151_1_plen_422_part_00
MSLLVALDATKSAGQAGQCDGTTAAGKACCDAYSQLIMTFFSGSCAGTVCPVACQSAVDKMLRACENQVMNVTESDGRVVRRHMDEQFVESLAKLGYTDNCSWGFSGCDAGCTHSYLQSSLHGCAKIGENLEFLGLCSGPGAGTDLGPSPQPGCATDLSVCGPGQNPQCTESGCTAKCIQKLWTLEDQCRGCTEKRIRRFLTRAVAGIGDASGSVNSPVLSGITCSASCTNIGGRLRRVCCPANSTECNKQDAFPAVCYGDGVCKEAVLVAALHMCPKEFLNSSDLLGLYDDCSGCDDCSDAESRVEAAARCGEHGSVIPHSSGKCNCSHGFTGDVCDRPPPEPEPEPEPEAPSSSPPGKTGNSKVPYVIGGVVLLVGVLAIAVTALVFGRRKASKKALAQQDALAPLQISGADETRVYTA